MHPPGVHHRGPARLPRIRTTALKILAPLALAALLGTSNLAFGDLIVGHVVDQNGVPVPGVNIDAIRVSNGNDQNLANDGTNATGDFSTTIPSGLYDIYFFAPPPPQTTLLPKVIKNVVVVGTKDLGTVQFQLGVSLSGHVQTSAGIPISQVTVRVIDQVAGADVPLAIHRTDAFGNFNVAVPANALEVQLLSATVPLQLFESRSIKVTPLTSTNLGNQTLRDGFAVTAHCQRASNAAQVPGVNVDVVDVATGVKLLTPNDNTDTFGNVTVIVPAGTYDISFCPLFASRLVTTSLLGQVISGTTDLGNIALEAGFVLSGTIRNYNGTPIAGADVDVRKKFPSTKIILCGDNSNASGAYAVMVPAGTLKVTFHPPNFGMSLGNDVHKNVVVSGDTVLDGALPFCAPAVNYGVGLAGKGGFVPHITTVGGAATPDNQNFALQLSNGLGGGAAFLTLSLGQASFPFAGGTLLVNANSCCSITIPVPLGGTSGVAGAGNKTYVLPFSLTAAVGYNLYAQYFVIDAAAPQGWSFSDAVRFPICR